MSKPFSCISLMVAAVAAGSALCVPVRAQEARETPVAISIAAATEVDRSGIWVNDSPSEGVVERPVAATNPRVGITVERATGLVGNPVTARRENFGEGTISGSFSTRPVTIRGQSSAPSGMPLASMRLSSSFGNRRHPIHGGWSRHSGIDLAAPYGTPIMATGSGVVTRAGSNGGYGLMVGLDHGDGTETRYAHMSRYVVRPGDRVSEGQVIGYVGSTGNSTGPHLHYEVLVGGRPVDPLGR